MGVCAIAELYDRHGPRLYRYALLIVADASAAEDALQEGFYQLAHASRRNAEVETIATCRSAN